MTDLAKLMPTIAKHFWGEPNKRHTTQKELRWGANGGRSVDLAKGTWFDHEAKEGGGVIDFLKREGITDPSQWLRDNGFDDEPLPRRRGKIVATYDYTDEFGKLLFQAVRFEPKNFSQRRPDGKGGWIWNLQGITPVLYRLPELEEALAHERPICIVEGEKDVERLRTHGFAATCNPMGAGKWRDEYAQRLSGADVIIIPDNDKAGRDHGEEVARSLHAAKRVRWLVLPGLGEKGDASDWFAAGGDREALDELIAAAPDWRPDLPFVAFVRFDQEVIPMREWIVPDRFARRHVGLMSGEGGAGKSILMLQLAIACVLGRDWLRSVPQSGPVLALIAEDEEIEIARRLKPILDFYGARFADVDHRLCVYPCLDRDRDPLLAKADREGNIVPTELYGELMDWAARIKPVLIIIDNVADVYGGSEIDRAQVRQFISLMQRPAIVANGALIMTAHPSLVGISSKTGLSGSTAWHNSVRGRAYMHGFEDENGGAMRQVEFKKSNYSRLAESVTLEWKDGLFLPVSRAGGIEQDIADYQDRQLFLVVRDRLNERAQELSVKPTSIYYAPKIIADQAEARAMKAGIKRMATAMEKLIELGMLKVIETGRKGHPKYLLVRTGKAPNVTSELNSGV